MNSIKLKSNIIALLVLMFLITSCNTDEKEIIVFPKGYTGYGIIIFNQKDGQAIKYENGKRVYEIPSSGILKTQFTANYGSVGFAAFYYDKIDANDTIPSFAEFDKLPMNKVAGLRGAVGTTRINSTSEDRIEFVEFYIGTKSQIDSAKSAVEKLDIPKQAAL